MDYKTLPLRKGEVQGETESEPTAGQSVSLIQTNRVIKKYPKNRFHPPCQIQIGSRCLHLGKGPEVQRNWASLQRLPRAGKCDGKYALCLSFLSQQKEAIAMLEGYLQGMLISPNFMN